MGVFCFLGNCNEEPGYFESDVEWFLGLQLLWGRPIYYVVECSAVFLAATHQMPVVYLLSCDNPECLYCQMSPEGKVIRGSKTSGLRCFS